MIREERWVPVTEMGDRWKPRGREDALLAMERYPAGGAFSDGEPWDGLVRLVHEVRYVTEWQEVES